MPSTSISNNRYNLFTSCLNLSERERERVSERVRDRGWRERDRGRERTERRVGG